MGKTVEKIKKICPNCGKEFKVRPSEDKKMKFCSLECRSEYNTTEISCIICGKKFRVGNYKKDVTKFCSRDCYDKNREENKTGTHMKCDNCGKDIYKVKSISNLYKNNFCSAECQHDFFDKRIVKTCGMCGSEYKIKKSHANNSRFCSNECHNKWMSIYQVGECNPNFEGKVVTCAYCGEKIVIGKYRLKYQNNFFCNIDHKIKYYSIEENRTEKQKIAAKNFARNAIKYTKPTLTNPHIIINNLLNKLNIKYNIEELIKYYKLDVYMVDYNLAIEVMGDFWHGSPLRYNKIKYKQQLDRIVNDKSKHTYTKKKYGFEILYLWESDIEKRANVCEKLILEYIKRNGKLENYHSFNYNINEFGDLKLNENLIIPYQNMKFSKYKDKIELINV